MLIKNQVDLFKLFYGHFFQEFIFIILFCYKLLNMV